MYDFEIGKVKFIRGGKYPQSNTVLIDDNVRAVIDPACDKEKLVAINQQQAIKVIINSHGHEDHILYNSRFPDAQLWVPALDESVFQSLDAFIEQFYPPGELDQKTIDTWTGYLNDVVRFQPRQPNRVLEDNEILEFGQTRVQVLHTPGHTPGHLSFHFLDEKVLFLADLDLVKFGPYYGDTASSIEATLNSLERLQKIKVDYYLVSHGREGILDGDPAHIRRYARVIFQREEKLLSLLSSGPKTLQAIIDHGIIYGGHRLAEGPWDLELSEKAMMQKHLHRLESQGIVNQENEIYKLV